MYTRVAIVRGVTAVFLLLLSGLAAAQTTKVSGLVTDAKTGEPLPFVNIAFINSRIGTTTDFDGKYSFRYLLCHRFHPGIVGGLHHPRVRGEEGPHPGDRHCPGTEQCDAGGGGHQTER
jgi:hypothetical protein